MNTVLCQHCGQPPQLATRVSIHGMYEMHLFHPVEGRTVDDVLAAWEQHNAVPQPAIVGGQPVDDLGRSWLCPAIVLDAHDKELRRVGKGVWPKDNPLHDYDASRTAFRSALLADPDISRILAERS